MSRFRLIDPYNRRLNYLRVSITDRCNLNCGYCEPRKRIALMSHAEILSYEEITRLVRIFTELGVSKVRVTGGEPLVRRGVCEFLDGLSKIAGLKDFSLTTNGVLLEKNMERLKNCGIKRINISLDTLKRERFEQITGSDLFENVWNAVLKALSAGFDPIKLNTVVLSGVNDDELTDLARLTFTYPFHVRFIEYMPIGKCSLAPEKPLLTPEIMKRLEKLGNLAPVESQADGGPARRFKYRGAPGEIGLISAMSGHFCDKCNRLRLTASGKLRTCLLSDASDDLKGPLRSGCSDGQIADLILDAVARKPAAHGLSAGCSAKVLDQMSSIGG